MGIFSLGGVHEFEIMAKKAGWKPDDLDRLAKDERLCEAVLTVLRGRAYVAEYVVDCGNACRCPEGCSIAPDSEQVASRVVGKIQLRSDVLAFHVDPDQQSECGMDGFALRAALAGLPVLTADVLDYLLEHPELIPRVWSGKRVCFWGTVYQRQGDGLFVRSLCYGERRWWSDCEWIERKWFRGKAAAVHVW